MVVNGICMVSVIMVSSVKTTIGLKEGNAKKGVHHTALDVPAESIRFATSSLVEENADRTAKSEDHGVIGMMGSAVQNVVLVLLQDHDNALLLLPALVVAIKRLHARMVIAQVGQVGAHTALAQKLVVMDSR